MRKDSPWLVVLMMHNLRKGGAIPLDAILSIRAMAQEVTQAGYQFIISFQVPSSSQTPPTKDRLQLCNCTLGVKACRPRSPDQDPGSEKLGDHTGFLQVPTHTYYQQVDPADAPQPFNREHVLEMLPLDLRPFIELNDFDEAFESYPSLGAMDTSPHPTCAFAFFRHLVLFSSELLTCAPSDSHFGARHSLHL